MAGRHSREQNVIVRHIMRWKPENHWQVWLISAPFVASGALIVGLGPHSSMAGLTSTHSCSACRQPASCSSCRERVRAIGSSGAEMQRPIRNRPREGAPATTTRPGGNPSSWPPRGKGTIYHQARLLAARIGLVPATRPEPLACRGRRAELLGPLADRPFRFLWLAATTPSTGSAFTPVALAFAVLGLGATATSLAGAAATMAELAPG